MAITVRKPKTAKLESQRPGNVPGQSGSAMGGAVTTSKPVTGQSGQSRRAVPTRPGVIAARPTNVITPNRGGIKPSGTFRNQLASKVFRRY